MSHQATTTTELPCGYMTPDGRLLKFATLREMETREEKILGSSNPDIMQVVANCLVGVGTEDEPSLISDRATLKDEVCPELLKGDYDWLLVQLRILSLGPEYDYTVLCPNTQCKKESKHTYDLDNIEVKEMPDPEERMMTWEARSGSTLEFRHLRGVDTEMLTEISQSNQDVLGKLLALHLVSIDGKGVSELAKHRKVKTGAQHLKAAVKLLDKEVPSYGERTKIRAMLLKARGMPDVDVISTCPHCGSEWTHRMPIDPGFLMPSAAV